MLLLLSVPKLYKIIKFSLVLQFSQKLVNVVLAYLGLCTDLGCLFKFFFSLCCSF